MVGPMSTTTPDIANPAPLRHRLAIVIVNYRTAQLTIDCLQSLADTTTAGDRPMTIVTDNLSGDDSVSRLQAAVSSHGWGDWVRIAPLGRNGGFAFGNNVGIQMALNGTTPPDYVLLLNPDTTVYEYALTELVRFMDAHPNCGIAGSRCENPDQTVRPSAFRFHTAAGELEREAGLGPVSRLLRRSAVAPPVRDEPHRTDWVSGAAMCVRRDVFDRIGLMDAAYFLYYEEADFILRAARANFECWYVPSSRIVHLCGQSSGVTGNKRHARRVPQYWFDSRRRYFVKNHGRLYGLLADLAFIAGATVNRLRRVLTFTPIVDAPRRYVDFVCHSVAGHLRELRST